MSLECVTRVQLCSSSPAPPALTDGSLTSSVQMLLPTSASHNLHEAFKILRVSWAHLLAGVFKRFFLSTVDRS